MDAEPRQHALIFEVAVILFLFASGFALVCAYFIHTRKRGRPQFERIEQQGGTKLLGKRALEMGYWAIQPIGKAFVHLGISPNALSWTSLAFGLIASAFAGFGHFGFAALGLLLSGLLDAFDGMIARMTNSESEAGYVLDSFLDRYVEFFFLAGLIIYYHQHFLGLTLSLLSLLGSYSVSYATLMARFKNIEIAPGSVIMRRVERISYLIIGAAASSVSVAWYEKPSDASPNAYPMLAVLGLIALLSNYSALRELFRMMRKIETTGNVVKLKPASTKISEQKVS